MFGDRLKILRTEAGLLQDQLAKLIGISGNTISKYESNINEPSLDILIKIANYFNVSIDYLLCRTDIRTPLYVIKEIQNEPNAKYFDLTINILKRHTDNMQFVYSLLSFMDENKKI